MHENSFALWLGRAVVGDEGGLPRRGEVVQLLTPAAVRRLPGVACRDGRGVARCYDDGQGHLSTGRFW
ncbi:MAG: hypothetical protein IH586_11720 [Anaerolineaceae bacterium]|nr:hypothetical protein [Anaerolineaceae bacterium]